MLVSVTRLRIRRWRFLPAFIFHTLRSGQQVRSSAGFAGGVFARERPLAFWTITVWDDEKAMKGFRNSASHLKAMPRLSHWCDEASYVHWQQNDASLPIAATAFERLRDSGQISKVRHPTANHAAGNTVGKMVPALLGPMRVGK